MAQSTARRRPSPPEFCPLDTCLAFLGRAWTVKILWYLKFGPRHFGELRRDLGAVSTKILTQRLRQLEQQGVVRRRVIAGKPARVQYRLTAFGKEFQPVLDAMGKVARRLRDRYDMR
jgi:DNA-binding HxlR family transcriptional regulator